MKLADINLDGIKTLLLDRDGVINVLRPNDYVKTWEEFVFKPDFLNFIAGVSSKIDHIFIVTNQRGVGKGIMSEEALQDIHQKMVLEIEKYGGRIDGIYYCTAIEESDPYRKPNIGMWKKILHDYPDVTVATTVMIGDSESDLQFALNCGIKGIKAL